MTREKHFVIRALTYSSIFLLALAALYAILSSKPHPIEVQSQPRGIMGLPPSPDCDPFYNTGKHRKWAKCMGVDYDFENYIDRYLWDHKYDD